MVDLDDPKYQQVPKWAEPFRSIKLACVRNREDGDMPPVVMALRNGETPVMVIAPQVDKELGLEAASILHRALVPDELLLGLDAHIYLGNRDYEEARKLWPGGLMQRACDEDGACATGQIMDCLTILRLPRGGSMSSATIGYHYHGRGTPFRWDEKPFWTDRPAAISGFMPDSFRGIMQGPTFLDDGMKEVPPGLQAMLRDYRRKNPEQTRAFARDAGLQVLNERGYQVLT